MEGAFCKKGRTKWRTKMLWWTIVKVCLALLGMFIVFLVIRLMTYDKKEG